jgi:hypothetical protein
LAVQPGDGRRDPATAASLITRDYFGDLAASKTNLGTTTVALFATRWAALRQRSTAWWLSYL